MASHRPTTNVSRLRQFLGSTSSTHRRPVSGYVGKLMCPQTHVLRRAWVFVLVLSYSRHMYSEVVLDQKTETWLELHRRAFEAFGGVPLPHCATDTTRQPLDIILSPQNGIQETRGIQLPLEVGLL